MDPLVALILLSSFCSTGVGLIAAAIFVSVRGTRRGATPKRRVDQSAWEPMFGRAHGDWYRWFAWRPVRTLDRGLVWLRPVWRRRVYKNAYLPGPAASWFQNVVELVYIFD